jgi:copper chaperone CopZ
LEKTVYISGLICAHCVAHVEKALKGLPGAGYEAAAITNT